MPSDEMLPVVNEEGDFIKLVPRRTCHDGQSMLLHPVIHLHIVNSDGNIFLQLRSKNKDIQPGRWDTSVGGHVDPGETQEQALKRETWEEVRLENFSYELIKKYIWQSEREREMVYSYITRADHSPVTDPAEVDEGRFWSREEIEENLGTGLFTPNFEYEYLHVLKNTVF